MSKPCAPTLQVIAACLASFVLPSVAHAVKCPNLHVVLDRSGSMGGTLGGGTRWTVARDAIYKVVDRYDGKLPIGLSMFPKASCDSSLDVRPGYKTRDKIKMAIANAGPTGSTPSGTAMRDAAMIAELRDPDRKQYVLLLTDGGPGCGGEPDSVTGTVGEIKKALMQNPSISTFVIGFGGGLGASEKAALTQMAEAGGKPAPTAEKFYKADNADELNAALESILAVVQDEFGMGVCDDSCYSNPCPNAGDQCIRGVCKPNPCANVSCGKDMYCYTDGVSAGMCVRACTKPCPNGTVCNQGLCVAAPCKYNCPPGLSCDAANKICIPDALCENKPADERCKGTSRCRGGECIDDPCRFITCPKGTQCANWDGSCVTVTGIPGSADMGTGGTDFEGMDRGCAAAPGGGTAAPALAFFTMAGVLLGLRRRRSARR